MESQKGYRHDQDSHYYVRSLVGTLPQVSSCTEPRSVCLEPNMEPDLGCTHYWLTLDQYAWEETCNNSHVFFTNWYGHLDKQSLKG